MERVRYRSPEIYNNEDLVDDREFALGELWLIRDCLVAIPDADRVAKRKEHYTRAVVVVDNNDQNGNKFCPVITIAPLSHRIDCRREFDIPLSPNEDGVKEESLLRMSLTQPVLKKDLHKCVGEISDDSKDEIIDVQLQRLGIDLDSL